MKYIRFLLLALFLFPAGAFAATAPNNDFMVAAQLLSAAKNSSNTKITLGGRWFVRR